MGIFNPSLVQAPPSLCSRCAYVVALRVDPLHQCHVESPLLKPDVGMPKNTAANAWFKGTAIAVLDRNLHVIRWTWLLNAPQHQVTNAREASRWFVPVGVSDRFLPPWAKSVFDVRLANVAGRLFVSYVCRRCAFSVAQLQLTGKQTADGGLTGMRAWQSRRYTSSAPWAQGRNQALFVAPRSPGGRDELMVQPWLNLVASFGSPVFSTKAAHCRKGSSRLCGATPPGTLLHLAQVVNEGKTGGFGELTLLGNTSHTDLARRSIGGFRLSTTSNLVRISRPGGCVAYLGVGHVHRSEGHLNRLMMGSGDRPHRHRRRRNMASGQETPSSASNTISGSSPAPSDTHTDAKGRIFKWGYHYTHFWYAMEATAPYRILATSNEFCLASPQNTSDCEIIQFVSGISLSASASEANPTLLASYGVNDCEAKVAAIGLDRVWKMLEPLEGRSLC